MKARNKIIVISDIHLGVDDSYSETVENRELCGGADTILPSGYFYARYAATWVLEGRPKVAKVFPAVANVPDKTDVDRYGAYLYHALMRNVSERMTPTEAQDAPIFDVHIAGFDDTYTYMDYYPRQMADGTISAPVLYKNIQRTWEERQKLNNMRVHNDFAEAVAGIFSWEYFYSQARRQYLENPKENVDVVVFGHTHEPVFMTTDEGKIYVNSGTWIDDNSADSDRTRTYVEITTGQKDEVRLRDFEG